MRRLGRSPAIAAAAISFAVAGGVLGLIHHGPRLSLPARTAISDAERGWQSVPQLHGIRWDRVSAGAVDGRLVRVTFWSGNQIAAEMAVRADGTVAQGVAFSRLAVPYGDWIAYQPLVLGGLTVLFVLMSAVVPLQRARNLDVLAATSLIAPVILLQHRYLDASVLAAAPGLGWLMLRLARAGLATPRVSAAPRSATPVFEAVTVGWTTGQRVRVLRLLIGALAIVFAMVGLSSPDAVDVIYAVMEGATKLLHGVLPYGHMPGDVIHGDTYPILSYALYVPVAALAPVNSTWSSVDFALGATLLAALLCAIGLRVGAGRALGRSPEAREAGLRAALTWLAFPPLLITVSTGTTDVMLAMLLLFAVVLWRRPFASSALLAAAGWFKLAPFALLPMWLAPLRGRRLAAAVGGFGLVSAAMVALLVALGGTAGPASMIHSVAYQFGRGSPQSLWAVLGLGPLQPIAEAAVIALIAGATVRFATCPGIAGEQARRAATAAAILIAAQVAADYWAFLYLVWIVPLLGLSVLEPGPLRVTAALMEPADPTAITRPVPALAR